MGQPSKVKIINNTIEAVKHYFSGKGEPVQLGEETINELRNSPEYQRVVNRLKSGIALHTTEDFDVNMTFETFHVGNTNVDYSTSCTTENCTTIFTEITRDSFSNPLDIGIEIPFGTPYQYTPSINIINYPNNFPNKIPPL